MYYVYVLQNLLDNSWYIGFSTNVSRRFTEHVAGIGGEYSRKKSGKWQIIYFEGYLNKSDALNREIFLKSGSGRRYLKKQIKIFLQDSLG